MATVFHRCVALGLGILSVGCSDGCDVLNGLGPYLAPTAAQVVLLEVPLDSLGGSFGADLPETGVTLSVTLFRVGQSGTAFTEDDLLSGASVTLYHSTFPEGMGLVIPESEDQRGLYSLNSYDIPEEIAKDTPLAYHPGTNYLLEVEHNGEFYEISQVVPDKTSLTSPRFEDYVGRGESVRVAWEPAESHAFIGVFNSSGEYKYSNLPEDPTELYTFLTQEPSTSHTVAESVFDTDDVFVMAAAAMRMARWENSADDRLSYISDNLNPLGSVFLAGSASVTAVTTIPLEYVTLSMFGFEDGAAEREGEGEQPVVLEVSAMGLDLAKWFTDDTDLDGVEDPMWLAVPGGTEFPLYPDPRVEGRFTLDPEDAEVLQYLPGETYMVVIEEEDRQIRRWLSGEPARGVMLDRPASWGGYYEIEEGDGLKLSWASPVDAVSVQVFNADGAEVFGEEWGDDAHDPAGPYGSFELPAEAFKEGGGFYSVAVLGVDRVDSFSDTYGLNLDFSEFITGQTVVAPVSVMPAGHTVVPAE